MKRLSLLLTFLVASILTYAQNVTISGKVSTSSGQGIEGISVLVKGTNNGVSTKSDGSFTINASSNATLVFSGIGYVQQEISVDGQTSINVTLVESQNELNSVVVTALGISKEARKLGYSVATVKGDELTKARTTNMALGLQGQVAGLNIHGTNGGPGGSARILLRGVSSITGGGSPLFVINGVPIDNTQRGSAGEWGGSDNGDGISNINPDDIETMTVLKGLSASALYGSRAANGVILITTKSGKKGNVDVEYNANYVVDKAMDNSDFQYVYGQGTGGTIPATQAAALATARFAWGAKMDGSSFTGWDGNSYSYSAYKDNIKDFYRNGPAFTNTVSASGGSDKTVYRLSLSNLNSDAIVRNSGLSRKTIDFSLDQKITDKLGITVNANYISQLSHNPPQLSDGPGNPNNGLFLAPNIKESSLFPGYDANGREVVFSDDNYVTNPWFVVNRWLNDISRKRLISSVSSKYYFKNWIYVMGRIGYDVENDRQIGVTPTGTDYSYNSSGQSGGIGISTAQRYELNMDALLGITHKLTDDINLDATIGGNARQNKYETVGVSGGPFVVPFLYTPYNVVNYGRSYGYDESKVHSGYYSLDFSYQNFLTLSTTGRYDAYSRLYNSLISTSERNLFTPSVSASFLFSQLLHKEKLNFGKLRLSYSETSGEPPASYQTATYYSVGNSINGVPTGSFSGTLPNLFLKPYKLREIEVGTEIKLFDNRLGFDIAYYDRKSTNEIMNATISWATGYNGSVIANGSMQNKGLEVLVTGTPVKTRDFNWNTSVNLTSISNKVLKTDAAGNNLSQGTYRPLNASTAFIVGMAGPQILAYDYTYDSKGEIVVDGSGLPIRGSLIPLGSVLPKFYGGFKNDLSYKNISLSVLVDYNFGNKILSATKYYALYRGLDQATLTGRETGVKVNGVFQDGTSNTVTASAQDYWQRMASISRNDVLDGDYIKLRQISLGYTISEKALAKVPVFSSIQISLVGRNLVTFLKKSDNIDPENGFSSIISYAGIEGTSLPSARSFGINANFKFKK